MPALQWSVFCSLPLALNTEQYHLPCAGFGANADHWRKNLPELGQHCRAYAIDLLGRRGPGCVQVVRWAALCWANGPWAPVRSSAA